jgi:hypothetical protein
MTKIYFILFCLIGGSSFAQTFSFELHFKDATGAKDTLIFGYDPNATNAIDVSFQEENIINQAWSNEFEARITVIDPNSMIDDGEYMQISEAGQLRKQITKEDCIDQSVFIHFIQLKNAVYPISITWDSTLFNIPCLSNTIITDWYPGVWFDAILGVDPQFPFKFNMTDSGTFTHTSTYMINSHQDTLGLLYFAMANENQIFVGLDELEKIALTVSPNPTNALLNLSIRGNQVIQSAVLFDINGQRMRVPMQANAFDLNELSNGIYYLEVLFESGKIEKRKVVKQ